MAKRKGTDGRLGRVLVLGLGKSGRSTANYCLRELGGRVEDLAIAAGAPSEEGERFAEGVRARGARVVFGDEAPGLLAQEGRFDVCVASPGIPPHSPLYLAAGAVSDEVISEVEFAWRESAADSVWVAVTGTNGKSTTTACIAFVLRGAGLAARAVGNIGDTCIDAVAAGDVRVYVAEVSSYQLASTSRFAPDVAVLLGITPDHVRWHGSLEAYAQAKYRVFDNLAASGRGVAVLDATNDVVRGKLEQLRARPAAERGFELVAVGGSGGVRDAARAGGAAWLDGEGVLRVRLGGRDVPVVRADALQILGEHNVLNALCAASAALALGLAPQAAAAGLSAFPPLEHRIEPCGAVGQVRCYNDSKATNVDATLRALESFPGEEVYVLLGGDDKGTDLAPLVASCHAHAAGAVCFGAAGERFAAAFEDAADAAPEGFALRRAQHLADALDEALRLAAGDGVVLLSPACASFDEFTSFEHRGRVFKQLVADRAARAARVAAGAEA